MILWNHKTSAPSRNGLGSPFYLGEHETVERTSKSVAVFRAFPCIPWFTNSSYFRFDSTLFSYCFTSASQASPTGTPLFAQ